MLTVTAEPSTIDEIHTALQDWFEAGRTGKDSSCTFSRKADDSGINVLIHYFESRLDERWFLFELKKSKLHLSTTCREIWSTSSTFSDDHAPPAFCSISCRTSRGKSAIGAHTRSPGLQLSQLPDRGRQDHAWSWQILTELGVLDPWIGTPEVIKSYSE